ncbi:MULTISPECIES: hypothetical protein [unclassified Paenibacillus]|uniref:hypothetical protein n=1 Tax=unclassified Paenibacillus TaxID=185978 RepID=UPI00104B33E4|nr:MULTISPECIES: hypothetical protein [unclassified Paenibacillus]NIK72102.1 hypothetical protein [Paenibacillus sp. BK720]TCM88558.1 hypothetical protein EV294_11524 [Paenibacillus sp. BK033]
MNCLRLTLILLGVLIFTACSNVMAESPKKAVYKDDPVLAFQKEVIPVQEEIYHRYFPDAAAEERFFSQAVSYFDNDNLKLVYMVYQLDSAEIKDYFKELKVKLGDKVAIKQARYSPKYLQDTANEVAEFVHLICEKGHSFTVSYNPIDEVIDIEMLLTLQQIADLYKKFDADILRITNKEPEPAIPL